MPNEHQLCNPEVPLSTRLATITSETRRLHTVVKPVKTCVRVSRTEFAGLYSILLPSVKALDLPGCSEAMAPLAAAGVRIQVRFRKR